MAFLKNTAFVLLLLNPWNAWGAQPTPLSCSDIALNLETALEHHLFQKEVTPELVDRMYAQFAYLLDPHGILFLASETQGFLALGKGGVYDGMKDISAFEELHKRALEGATELRQQLNGMISQKQDILGHLRQDSQHETSASIPRTSEERAAKIRARLASKTEALISSGYDPSEAFDMALLRFRKETGAESPLGKPTTNLILSAWMAALDPNSHFIDDEDERQLAAHSHSGDTGARILESREGVRITRLMRGGAAQTAGLRAGDEITAIWGVPLKGLSMPEIKKLLRGEKGAPVEVTINRGGETRKYTLVRTSSHILSALVQVPLGKLGLLAPARFYQGLSKDIGDLIQSWREETPLSGIVVDLRGNPGGDTREVATLLSAFLGKRRAFDIFGSFIAAPTPLQWSWEGAVVVLVDADTASAAEIFAAALQDYGRAVIVGGDPRTYGKGTQQISEPAEVKSGPLSWRQAGLLRITDGIVVRANGKSTQLAGVEADIVIPGSRKNPRRNADLVGALRPFPPGFERSSWVPSDHVPWLTPEMIAKLKTRFTGLFQSTPRWAHSETWSTQQRSDRQELAALLILEELVKADSSGNPR